MDVEDPISVGQERGAAFRPLLSLVFLYFYIVCLVEQK